MTCVDIIMPVYNAGPSLAPAVASILAQTHSEFRLTVVDDCSTDTSIDVVRSFQDPRITLIQLEQNCGPAHARNIGISRSNSPYIAFADADDVSSPERIRTQVVHLINNPAIDVLGSQYVGQQSRTTSNLPERHWEISAYLWFGNCIANPTVMIRRSSLERSAGLEPFNVDYRESEDYELWLRLCLVHKLKFHTLSTPLVEYDENVDSLRAREREGAAVRVRSTFEPSARARLPQRLLPARHRLSYLLARSRVYLRSKGA